MAEGKICVCPQCGKKFKLKADFSSASFACTACGATVWVEGKPKGPSAGRKRAGGRSGSAPRAGAKRRGARRGGGGRAAPARGGQRRGRQAAAADDDEQGGRRSRYQQQNNSQNVIIAVVGLVIVVGAVAFFLMKDDDKPAGTGAGEQAASGTQEPVTDEAGGGATGESPSAGETGSEPSMTADPSEGADEEPPVETGEPAKKDEEEPAKKTSSPLKKDTKPKYRIEERDGKKVKVRISKWNPPDDIGHLESTPADVRKQIDGLIAMMFDPFAGRDSIDAKQKLAQIGKPAYLPILAKMAKMQDQFKWDNSHDDNVNMASVKLADECLRLMDGYLEANEIGIIRPGTDERYYGYVVRMHYKRWKETLEGLDKMPGPFDPSIEYAKETETEDD